MLPRHGQGHPRVAEPRPDTLRGLSELMHRTRCDVGFAQDPDGDRLAVADEQGRILDNDDVLAIAIEGHRTLASSSFER